MERRCLLPLENICLKDVKNVREYTEEDLEELDNQIFI